MAGVRLSGMWWKKDQSGKKYLEGTLGMAVVRLYVNDTKKTADSPDAALFVVDKPQPPKPGDPPHPYAPQAARPKPRITPKAPPAEDPEGFGF